MRKAAWPSFWQLLQLANPNLVESDLQSFGRDLGAEAQITAFFPDTDRRRLSPLSAPADPERPRRNRVSCAMRRTEQCSTLVVRVPCDITQS